MSIYFVNLIEGFLLFLFLLLLIITPPIEITPPAPSYTYRKAFWAEWEMQELWSPFAMVSDDAKGRKGDQPAVG